MHPLEQKWIRRRLRKRPLDSRDDPRSNRDPYWRLRSKGWPTSIAKRALRGELSRLVLNDTPDTAADEYKVDAEDVLVWPPKPYRMEIVTRPESLTDQIVSDAPTLGYEYSMPDGNVPGLTLRIRKSGHKSYVLYFRIRRQKKTRKIRIATVGAITLDMAREIAREHLMVARMGKDPAVCSYAKLRRAGDES
jgi:hypothetical protein